MTDIPGLRLRAEQALRDGQVADGIVAYRALVAADPASPSSWYNLAYLYRCARRFEEALDAYAKALELGIDRPEEVHLNRAVILSEFREQIDAAMRELESAVELAPDFVPAWLNLGNLHSDCGQAVPARHAYQRALSIDPRNGRGHAKLAAIDVFEGKGEVAAQRLSTALSTSGSTVEDRAEMLFALANCLDARGEYDAAFAALVEGHRMAVSLVHPSARYDATARAKGIDDLIRARPGPPVPTAEGSTAPIFVCGMFRSGSTLVERMLSRHSRISSGGELEIVPAMVRDYPGQDVGLLGASIEHITTLRDRYMAEVRELYAAADLIVDKRPDNFLHIGVIKRMFPNAKIINTVRNDFDTALSVHALYFDEGVNYGHSLETIGHWIGQYHRLLAHWRGLYAGDIFDVSYDDLVRQPEKSMRDLLDFCGVGWEDAVLAPDTGKVVVRTASVWQVRQSLHRRSSGRWRNYERHLQPLINILGYAPK